MSPEELEDYSFLFFMWSGKKDASRLDLIAFEALRLLNNPSSTQPTATTPRTHTGIPLPSIVHSYLAGTIGSDQAAFETLDAFDAWAAKKLSTDDSLQVRKMLSVFFDPQSLARCMKPIPPVVTIMTDSSRTHTLYVLSNWDHDSFKPFYDTYKSTVFALIDPFNIVISAHTGYIKPQREIFEWFLTKYHLDPTSCVFIDDQEENVLTAQSFGIESFHLTHTQEEALKKWLSSF